MAIPVCSKAICISVVWIMVAMMPDRAFSQELEAYKDTLSRATTSREFEKTFKRMISTFRSGKLAFSDQDIHEILAIADEKDFVSLLLPRVYSWLGTMYGNGRMDEALTYFMKSAALYREQGNRMAEALCSFEIAFIQHKAGNETEARTHYLEALTLGGDSMYHRTRIDCYNGLAMIDRENGRLDSASGYFRRAYNIAKVHRDTAWMAILSGNFGSLHLRRGNYDSSIYYYKRNLDLIKKVDERENLIETYAHLGRIAVEKSQPVLGLKYLDSAMLVAERHQMKFTDFFNPLDYIHESYSLAYAQSQDFEQAYREQKRFHEVSYEKQQSINSRNLKQLQLTDAFNRKQQELSWLQKINEANVSIIRQQQLTGAALIFILLLMCIGIWMTSRQRKKWNEQLSRSNRELARMNRVKNKLFSVISHDLRGPVANLQGVLGLFKTGDLVAKDFPETLVQLTRQVEASGEALENLLHWAKAEFNDSRVNPGKIVVHDLVQRVASQLKENFVRKSITLNIDLIPHINVWADAMQLEIVLRNLISNAIKFTNPQGTVHVEGTRMDDTVLIKVRDNGIGIKEDDLRRLFTANARFSTLGTQKEKGTGIGLTIVQEMVLQNHGTIAVESILSQGTTFTVSLPGYQGKIGL